MDVEIIHEIRQLIAYLRAAEFKAGVLHLDLLLSQEKSKVAQDVADQLDEKLVALAVQTKIFHDHTTPAANA